MSKKSTKSEIDSFMEFSQQTRDSSSSSSDKKRVVSPSGEVKAQLQNWDEGFRAQFRVMKTIKALLTVSGVSELAPTSTLVSQIMKENLDLIDLQMAAQAAIGKVVLAKVSEYDVIAVPVDEANEVRLRLTSELRTALIEKDAPKVKSLQKELVKLG